MPCMSSLRLQYLLWQNSPHSCFLRTLHDSHYTSQYCLPLLYTSATLCIFPLLLFTSVYLCCLGLFTDLFCCCNMSYVIIYCIKLFVVVYKLVVLYGTCILAAIITLILCTQPVPGIAIVIVVKLFLWLYVVLHSCYCCWHCMVFLCVYILYIVLKEWSYDCEPILDTIHCVSTFWPLQCSACRVVDLQWHFTTMVLLKLKIHCYVEGSQLFRRLSLTRIFLVA